MKFSNSVDLPNLQNLTKKNIAWDTNYAKAERTRFIELTVPHFLLRTPFIGK